MSRPAIERFTEEHVDAAAVLLADRHRRHRLVEPLLPAIDDFRAQIEVEWLGDAGGTSGAVALSGEEVVGYLIGKRLEDQIGSYVWSHVSGHAVREPELVRDLYAFAADRWVEEGLTRHFVFAPMVRELIEPWFRLAFGASAALAMRETAAVPAVDIPGVLIRASTPADLEPAAALDRLLFEHLQRSPSFSGLPLAKPAEFVDDWRTTWDEEQFTHFVAQRDGQLVGHILLYCRPADLRVPPDSIDLANAATEPGLRGSGVGLALTAHVLTWAHEHGYPTMITDWRMTNLEASRFWPRRGFRETFLRLYRSIP